MPKPAKFTGAAIVDAAAALVADGGPSAATVVAIGAALGAPSGSIYHRFPSRDALLGRLWLDKAAFFQDRFAAAFTGAIGTGAGPVAAGLEAALSLPRAVRVDLTAARVMLLHRREDFLGTGWPDDMRAEAERLGAQVEQLLTEITRRLFGSTAADARRTATFAVLDVPYAAVRRYVGAGKTPPTRVDDLVRAAYHGVIAANAPNPE